MAKLLCRSTMVLMILLLAFTVTFAWVETLGPKDSEIIKWKESMRAKSATERIVAPKPTYKNKVVQQNPELVPLRNIQSYDYNFEVAQGFEATIDYTRPTYGQFIFEGTDSMGVWFRPATDCRILKVQILFSDESGLLGEQLTVRIFDVLDDLPAAVSPQVPITGNGKYGFTEYMKCIPSPTGRLLGSYPLNVTKVGFNLATGWCETDLTALGGSIDVGKRDFFVALAFPEGNTGDADVYYGPGEEQHAPGDYHSFKWYHTGGTYSPGVPNWVSRLNFTLRVVVDYYGDPPPFIEDVTELNSVYYSCDPGPYTVSAHIHDIGTSTFTGAVTKAQLIYFTEEISDADTIDITANKVGDVYSGQIPSHPVGTTVWYYFRAEDNGASGPDATMHWSRVSPKSFMILEANPDATVLIVQDGGSADVDMYANVLKEGGWIYDIWNTTDYGEPTLCALKKYSSLFWLQGIGTSGVLGMNLDTTIVPDYLDDGGNLFMVSTDYVGLVEGENFTGEWTAATWPFLTDYLKVSDFASDANADADGNSSDSLYIGEAGNAISGFLGEDTLWLAPKTKAYPYYGEYYSWADEVAPTNDAELPFSVWSESDDDWVEASSMYDGSYKMVFLPFYLEAAMDIEQFNTIVKNVLAFFGEKAAPIAAIESGPRYVIAANAVATPVVASATDGDGTVVGMELGTSVDGASYTWSAMTLAEGKYSASIPALSVGDTMFFQVRATDDDGLKGYAGPWGYTKINFTPVHTDLLYCGDDPYDWYYGGNVDSIVVASLDRIDASYDLYDVDANGYVPPSYIGFLDQYKSVIWHGYADWVASFPEATGDNPFYPFVSKGGNICFSSEEMVAASHFDDGDYSPVPGDAAYDVLGIGWVGYDFCYDSIKVITDPLVESMDANIKLNELPFGYMGDLFDPVNYGVEGNVYIMDAWLADYGVWYGDWECGLAWKENFGSKKVIVPFPLAALNDANRDAFLGNVIEWFGTTDAVQRETSNLPTDFALKQNFPNPFNPTTTIRYELPQSENVRLIIYNMLGQKVRTLVNEQHTAGRYSVTWDGKDDAGRMVGSGLYFYQVQAGNFVKTAKMVFLK